MRNTILGIGGALVLASSLPLHAANTTWNVASNGIDSLTCGGGADPCRTINRAIANANSGDTIFVGPGRYGDLNGDHVLSAIDGDEDPTVVDPATGCDCMILVNKTLTIQSRTGAGATMLDGAKGLYHVVFIDADDVTFGKEDKGFTVANGGGDTSVPGVIRYGLVLTASTHAGRVSGNIAVNNTFDGILALGFGAVISNNLAANNLAGFGAAGAGNLFKDNRALNNDVGFDVTPRFEQVGNPVLLSGNVAEGNGVGVNVAGPFDDGDIRIIGNSLVANRFVGLLIDLDVTVPLRISENNFYGNNVIPDSRFTATPLLNCGLANVGTNAVSATNNFWGAATGPGTDPADDVCNQSPGGTTVVPFATHEFKSGASAF